MAKADLLFERVLAAPDDAGLRQVWADTLVESGDPRGELIQIDLAAAREGGVRTPAQDKRARSLVAAHRHAWLGKLVGVVQTREGLVFDRGLLAGCQIQVKSLAAFQATVGDPLWATVRKMWFCDKFAWDPRIVPLLAHPAMVSLREIVCVGMNNVFRALSEVDGPLPFTSIWTMDDDWKGPILDRAGFTAPALPALERLGFTLRGDGEFLLDLPVVRRVTTLGISSDEPASMWLTRIQPLANVKTLELRPGWLPLHGEYPFHYIVRFRRGSDGAFSKLEIDRRFSKHEIAFLASGRRGARSSDDLTSIPANAIRELVVRTNAPAGEWMKDTISRFRRADVSYVVAP